jgi:hypothetical protein
MKEIPVKGNGTGFASNEGPEGLIVDEVLEEFDEELSFLHSMQW